VLLYFNGSEIPKFLADRATKLSESRPYKITTVQQYFPLDWETIWKHEERGCHVNVVAGIQTVTAGFSWNVCVAAGVFFNNSNEFLLRFNILRFTFHNGYKSIHQREVSRGRVDL
jgi:hypothetical protein